MRTLACLIIFIAACGGGAKSHPAAENQVNPGDGVPMDGDGLDPIEHGIDWSWRDGDSCKPLPDDADAEFDAAYKQLCNAAMARVIACVHDAAFLATQPVDMVPVEDELAQMVGTPDRTATLCHDLALDQFCGESAGTYTNAYRAADLRSLAGVTLGDCAATGAAFPGLLSANGGD